MMPWVGAFVTYLLLPGCLFFGIGRVMLPSTDGTRALAALCLGLAPLLASWLLAGLLAVVPGQGDAFYGIAVLLVFSLVGLSGLRWRPAPAITRPIGLREAAPFLLVAGALCLLLVLQAVLLPLTGNDPLEYALVSKLFYQSKSLAQYPFHAADQVTGYYAGFSHPLGYVSLLVWTSLFDHGTFGWLSKSISPFFTLTTIALFLTNRRKDHLLHGALCAVILLGCPLYFQTSAICHIDSLRLYAMYLALFCLDRALGLGRGREFRAWLGLCGLAGGLSLFSHSIGLLTLPFLGLAWLALSRRPWSGRVAALTVICALAVAVGGVRYARNMLEYGEPLRDQEPVWDLKSIDFTAYNDRLKTIVSPADRILNGVFTPFVRYNDQTDNSLIFFGFSFWLAVLAVLRPASLRGDPMAVSSLLCMVLFFILCLASVLAGSSLIIKNPRYFLTVLPFAAYLGAVAVAAALKWIRRLPGRRTVSWAVAVLILVLAGPTLGLEGLLAVLTLPNLPALASDDLTFLRGAYGSKYFTPAGYGAIAWIREHAPADSRILVFRKNEVAFYSGRRILADTDPALLPFYAATDPEQALSRLRELNVTHIFVPEYQQPTFTNSQACVLADDPRFSELVYCRKGYRVYRLRSEPRSPADACSVVLPEPTTWSRPAGFIPSFFAELAAPLTPFPVSVPACPLTEDTQSLTVTSAGIYSGPGPIQLPPSACFGPSPLEGGTTYRFECTVHGQGWLRVFLLTYAADGGLTWDILYDGVTRVGDTTLARLALVPADAWQYRLLFVSGPRDILTVSEPRLVRVDHSAGPAPREQVQVLETGTHLATGGGESVWSGRGDAPVPDAGLVRTAERVRRLVLLHAALRRTDATTWLETLAVWWSGSGPVASSFPIRGHLVVRASGEGRIDCFVAWGSEVRYVGAIELCGKEGEATLPVVLPDSSQRAYIFFHMQTEGQGLRVLESRLERS